MNKIEILAPAGNMENLKMAIAYGADAVYIGGKQFGLRAFANNFTIEQMNEAVTYAHQKGKRVYVTLNIFPRNEDFSQMGDYIRALADIKIDALIISDPGILTLVKELAPELEIHLSTQANNTNWRSANFWHEQGVKRIILARELSLAEIIEIREKTPSTLELEAFVHGAMCMSYSGRCTISNYLSGRDANRGECSQPCRWKYHIVEEKRPGQYFPIVEDDKGTYLFNSKDLCMIGHVKELVEAGLVSLKIEGRMKSSYYVAIATHAYRNELDRYLRDKENYSFNKDNLIELEKTSHRPFTTGFYFGDTDKITEYSSTSYIRTYDFVGLYKEYLSKDNLMLIEQRNSFAVGDKLEIVQANEEFFTYEVKAMYDEDLNPIKIAPHPQQKVYLPIDRPLKPWAILRRGK